jgi:hypothetical protein
MASTRLTKADLIPDSRLGDIADKALLRSSDTLNHAAIAEQIAALVRTADGYENIAVFGAWGTGKSSLFDLVERELSSETSVMTVQFDAWSNAGAEFRINFLSRVGQKLKVRPSAIAELLYESRQARRIPVRKAAERTFEKVHGWKGVAAAMLALVAAIAAVGYWFPSDLGAALTRSLFVALAIVAPILSVGAVLGILDFASSTVTTSVPSSNYQFDLTLKTLLKKARSRRLVVLVDELDRCRSEDVWVVLEGLRTFLRHSQLTFVVAFDRPAVERAIVRAHSDHNLGAANSDLSRPGEYLDKIFQYQLTLPHRAPSTWVPYATGLAEGSKGLWSEFDAALRSTVLNLLVPRHTATARRVKTLMNDFVVTYRSLETLGIVDPKRAAEVATMTVIRKDFPELARAMERNTSLLHAIVGRSSHASDETSALAASFSASYSAAALAPRDTRKSVGAEGLDAEFERYVRLLAQYSIQVLPRPDVIRMTAANDLVHFEDGLLRDRLAGVYDEDRTGTAMAIREASETDQVAAVRHLLGELRGEPPNLVATLISVICVALRGREAVIQRLSSEINHATSLWVSSIGPEPENFAHLEVPELVATIELLGPRSDDFTYENVLAVARSWRDGDEDHQDEVFAAAIQAASWGPSGVPPWALAYSWQRLTTTAVPLATLVTASESRRVPASERREYFGSAMDSAFNWLTGALDSGPGDEIRPPEYGAMTVAEVEGELRDAVMLGLELDLVNRSLDTTALFCELGVRVGASHPAHDLAIAATEIADHLAEFAANHPESARAGILGATAASPESLTHLTPVLDALDSQDMVGWSSPPALVSVLRGIESGALPSDEQTWGCAAVVAEHDNLNTSLEAAVEAFKSLSLEAPSGGRISVGRFMAQRALDAGREGLAVETLADLIVCWHGQVPIAQIESTFSSILKGFDDALVAQAIRISGRGAEPPEDFRYAASSMLLRVRSHGDFGALPVGDIPGAKPTGEGIATFVSLAARAGAPLAVLRQVRPTGDPLAGTTAKEAQAFGQLAEQVVRDDVWGASRAAGAESASLRAIAGAGLSQAVLDEVVEDASVYQRAVDRAAALAVFEQLSPADSRASSRLAKEIVSISSLNRAEDLKAFATILVDVPWMFTAAQRKQVKTAISTLNRLGKKSPLGIYEQNALVNAGLLETVRRPDRKKFNLFN